VAEFIPFAFPEELVYLRVPVKDDVDTSIGEHFDSACSFIDAAHRRYKLDALSFMLFLPAMIIHCTTRNGRVLVHCLQGKSRSVAIVVASLLRSGR
jgi:protein-tyrosine phosphatase